MNKKFPLRITPYGGVSEIGSNMTVFETENHQVVIDYGILFPYDDNFDINYLIVNTAKLNTEKPITLFITHGHEDHIGAVHHFVREFPDADIYAPKFAANLIRKNFEYREITKKITEYVAADILTFDDFELHPVHVTHSIPETHGVIFKRKDNSIATLFISDFKYDENPIFEAPFDLSKIERVFNPCTRKLAMLDSTNILNENKTVSESELTESFDDIFKKNKRTFITMFASNSYRFKNILESAKRNDRRIILIGRSLDKYLDVATQSEIINAEDYPMVDLKAVVNFSDTKNVFIVTGSQGEHLGATRRIANGDQKNITLNEDDLFVFSSKPIPGNEDSIYRIYNLISNFGTEIITFRDKLIHASGHPGQEDLKQVLSRVTPTNYIPIHGEIYFLRKHCQFINKHFPQIKSEFLTNFSHIYLSEEKMMIQEDTPLDPILIHGKDLPIEKERISQRRKIAITGAVFVSANIKSMNINITVKGLPVMADKYLQDIKEIVHHQAFVKNKNRDYDYTCDQTRIAIRNFYKHFLGYKPITIVQLV